MAYYCLVTVTTHTVLKDRETTFFESLLFPKGTFIFSCSCIACLTPLPLCIVQPMLQHIIFENCLKCFKIYKMYSAK